MRALNLVRCTKQTVMESPTVNIQHEPFKDYWFFSLYNYEQQP